MLTRGEIPRGVGAVALKLLGRPVVLRRQTPFPLPATAWRDYQIGRDLYRKGNHKLVVGQCWPNRQDFRLS